MAKEPGTPSRLGALRGSVRDSLRALLERRLHLPSPATEFQGGDEESVRQAFLDLIDPPPAAHDPRRLAALRRRIQFSPDCEALWYLRSELLQMLAAGRGEEQARQQLAALDHLFPRALTRRR